MMRKFLQAVHDMWCAVTKRCRVLVLDDPYIDWMREQERAANASAAKIRQRRANEVEDAYLRSIRAKGARRHD
jgi:hypothetical protein